jgi:hypothetical protein
MFSQGAHECSWISHYRIWNDDDRYPLKEGAEQLPEGIDKVQSCLLAAHFSSFKGIGTPHPGQAIEYLFVFVCNCSGGIQAMDFMRLFGRQMRNFRLAIGASD